MPRARTKTRRVIDVMEIVGKSTSAHAQSPRQASAAQSLDAAASDGEPAFPRKPILRPLGKRPQVPPHGARYPAAEDGYTSPQFARDLIRRCAACACARLFGRRASAPSSMGGPRLDPARACLPGAPPKARSRSPACGSSPGRLSRPCRCAACRACTCASRAPRPSKRRVSISSPCRVLLSTTRPAASRESNGTTHNHTSGFCATSAALRHPGALPQQLGHDPARRVHAGVRQDDRIALGRAFCHRARHQLPAALGQIDVARLP